MESRIFAEIGFGNSSFLSTEIEKRGKEYRLSKLIMPSRINGVYIRIWIIKLVISKFGFNTLQLAANLETSEILFLTVLKNLNFPLCKVFDRLKMLVVEDKKICDEYLTTCWGVSKFLSIFFICISTYNGITFKKKIKSKFKFLFGIEGFNQK